MPFEGYPVRLTSVDYERAPPDYFRKRKEAKVNKALLSNVASALAMAGALVGCSTMPVPDQLPSEPIIGAKRIDAAALPIVREVDERFQSYQIGMSHLTGGDTWVSYDSLPQGGVTRDYAGDLSAVREPRAPTDLSNQRLRNLTAALGPLYIRYGGTTSNSVYFQDNDEPRLAKIPVGYSRLLTRAAWRRAIDFAKEVDAKIVTGFTVSAGVRDAQGVWTPVHAKAWLDYTKAAGGEIYAAEMFNEPNMAAYDDMLKDYSPAHFAKDYAAYRAFMDRAAPDVKLVGPGDVDVGLAGEPRPKIPDTEAYFSAVPNPKFDIVSYHYYGALSERCAPPTSDRGISADNALSEEWLARQDAPLQKRKALRDKYAPGAPIWNTETGAAACGGPQWQPTFRDTFRHLDTQARLSKQGLDAIFTHALISGSNGVIDEKTFLPNPNYWAALMWRRLMGTKILDAGAIEPGLHVYAHCQRGVSGGVTLLAINLEDKAAAVSVNTPADLYALTASDLSSRTVLLNGQPLALGAGDTVPQTTPVRVATGDLMLAPTSVNFITLPQAGNPGCTI
jgi:heparanase